MRGLELIRSPLRCALLTPWLRGLEVGSNTVFALSATLKTSDNAMADLQKYKIHRLSACERCDCWVRLSCKAPAVRDQHEVLLSQHVAGR